MRESFLSHLRYYIDSNILKRHGKIWSVEKVEERRLPGVYENLEKTGLLDLGAMIEEMRNAPEIVRPSAYWTFLNEQSIEELKKSGFENFKRKVNNNYFQVILFSPRYSQFRAALIRWIARPTMKIFSARVADPESLPQRLQKGYALFVAMLWEYANRTDRRGFMAKLEEPGLGNPISVVYRRRMVTQDLCNSVIEFTSIMNSLPDGVPGNSVLELGPGYGRLAWVFLKANPNCRYFLCDIPPALAVAERYLSELFPDKKIFLFRHFDDYEEVRKEMGAAQIIFLTPNQLELVPPIGVGLFVNISSLSEMRPDQIRHYLSYVDKHCGGYFYSKQSKVIVNAYDNVIVRAKDYKIPDDWKTVFMRSCPIQTKFFEAMYRVR
jgi:putative sugar O-methyltransferase